MQRCGQLAISADSQSILDGMEWDCWRRDQEPVYLSSTGMFSTSLKPCWLNLNPVMTIVVQFLRIGSLSILWSTQSGLRLHEQ